MADNINDINRQLAELRTQLGHIPASPFQAKDIQQAKAELKGLTAELREMSGDLDYISKSFKDSVNEMSRQNIYLQSAKKSLGGISDISRKLVDFRRGENTLSDKQLHTLKDQARVHFEQLKLAEKSGTLGKANRAAVRDSIKHQQAFNKALDRTIELNKEVNSEIGLLGQGLEGVGKLLEKIGFAGVAKPISDAIQTTKEARLQIKLNKDAIADLKAEAQSLNGTDAKRNNEIQRHLKILESQNKALGLQTNKYKNIGIALKEQFTTVNLIDLAIEKIITGFLAVNRAAVDYTRLSGINAVNQAALNSRLATSVDYLETAAELTSQLGMSATSVFSDDDIAALAEAKNLLGLSAEQAGKLGIKSKLANTSIDAFQDNLLKGVSAGNKLNNSLVAPGIALQDVLNTSEDISMSLGNNPNTLGKAAVAARAFGLNLQQVNDIASSLLNFEDSIGNELEAELMTGKYLNLEKAREYALTNDLEGLSRELAKNGATAAEFSKMNRLEQESLAKALGMNREQLAKSILAQEASKSATLEQRAAVMGVTKEQMQSMDIQERLTKVMEKLAQAFAPIFEAVVPVIEAVLSALQPVAMLIGYMAKAMAGVLKPLLVIYGLYKGMQVIQAGMLGVETAMNAQRMIAANRGLAQIGTNRVIAALEEESLATRIAGNAQLLFQLVREQGIVGIKTWAKGLDEESLVRKGILAMFSAKEFITEQAKTGWRLLNQNLLDKELATQLLKAPLLEAEAGLNSAIALAATSTEAATAAEAATLPAVIGLKEAEAVVATETAIAETTAAEASSFGAATIPILMGLGVVAAAMYAATKMKDGVIDPKKGPVVSGEFGSVQLHPNDQIVAGTNLTGGRGSISQAASKSDSTHNEIRQMREENKQLLTALLNKSGDVYMDTNKVGRAQVLGSYKSS